jgi:hypothetical protein
MYYALSKSQKKIARIVMDKGIDKHYFNSLKDAGTIILKWQNGAFKDNKEAYMSLFNCVRLNDDKIAEIYNDKGGSRWVEVMALQLADGVITTDDLKDFDPEVKDAIIEMMKC